MIDAKTDKPMRTFFKHLILVAAIAAFAQMANATPTLIVWAGGSPLTITDGGVGDVNPATGQITWIGSIGDWTFNVDTGTTYPIIGTLAFPQLDLNVNATSDGAGGTIWIYFSADGFGPSSGTSQLSVGGTTAGTVSAGGWGGTSNSLFDMTASNLLANLGPLGGPAFSGDVLGGNVTNGGPYSLTEVIEITHSGAGMTTVDAALSVPDGGTTAMLVGFGLLGLSAISRRRKVAKV